MALLFIALLLAYAVESVAFHILYKKIALKAKFSLLYNFRSLFANPDSKESTALDLVPLTPTGFEILLDYIYSGNLAITADNCSAVLSAAICLQVL